MFPDKKAKFVVFLICVILGTMLTTQFKSAEKVRNTLAQQRAEDLASKLRETEKERQALIVEVNKLRHNQPQDKSDSMKQEMKALKAKAGELPLHGPGIIVVVDDSKVATKPGTNANLYIIHDDDLLRLINELRAAGAEALSVNDERILDVSEVRCAGPTVSVNNNKFTPPYEIKAIGEPKTLESALRLRGGIIETLKFWGISVNVEQSQDVNIGAFKGVRRYEYAKVKEKEGLSK